MPVITPNALSVVDSRHDGRHHLDSAPLARESIPYIMVLPEHQIALFTYTWVNSASEAGAAIAIFGPGIGDTPIRQRLNDRPVPRDMDFDAWTIDGLHMAQDLAFNRSHLRWATPKATLEFEFTAIHPPYAYGSDPRGCPVFCADDRIEQAGTVRGDLRLGARRIAFNGTAHRDHSWGTRD